MILEIIFLCTAKPVGLDIISANVKNNIVDYLYLPNAFKRPLPLTHFCKVWFMTWLVQIGENEIEYHVKNKYQVSEQNYWQH